MINTIKLNVSGRLFETTEVTLRKIPYFNNAFDDVGVHKEMFIDRPGHVFKHILALAIDPNYNYPDKYISELNFYLMTERKPTPDHIEATIDEIIKCLNKHEFNHCKVPYCSAQRGGLLPEYCGEHDSELRRPMMGLCARGDCPLFADGSCDYCPWHQKKYESV